MLSAPDAVDLCHLMLPLDVPSWLLPLNVASSLAVICSLVSTQQIAEWPSGDPYLKTELVRHRTRSGQVPGNITSRGRPAHPCLLTLWTQGDNTHVHWHPLC